jgi:hypothetical protein
MYKIISALIISILIFSGGMFAGYKLIPPKQIIKEVIVTKNVDHIIYRDYSKVDCCEIAKKYDNTPFRSEYKVNSMTAEYTDITLRWDLYERNGEQQFKVPVYQSGNFKFYLGLGIGAGIIGGLGYVFLK